MHERPLAKDLPVDAGVDVGPDVGFDVGLGDASYDVAVNASKQPAAVAPTWAGSGSRLAHYWRNTSALHGLFYLAAFQLGFSFAYINYFRRCFHYKWWVIPIHLSLVAGVAALTVVCPGVILNVKTIRDWRPTRFVLAMVAAAGFALVATLCLTDLAANLLWGNSISFKLASRYLLRRDVFSDDSLSISGWVYAGLGIAICWIFAIYLIGSRRLQDSLEEIFLPARRLSLFKDRGRARKSGLVIALMMAGYAGYLYALSNNLQRGGIARREPLAAFFSDSNDIYDFNFAARAAELRKQEPLDRASYPKGLSFARRNVIIIIVDALRADHTQVYGYDRPTTPFLESLLEAGKLKKVEFATSTCAESNCGILSTLASKTLRDLVPQNFKLHDLLHDQGYKTYFVLSGVHDWYGLKQAYGDDLTYYFDGPNSTRYSWYDDRLISEGLEKVPDYNGTPAFFYIHLMSVHIAGKKLDEFRRYEPSVVTNSWQALFARRYDLQSIINNYDNGVTQADAIIEQIFSQLDAKGYLSGSLAVILADHGEGLGERGNFGHVVSLYQECIRIPLLFYDDPQAAYGNLQYATQIDIAPTIADRLGLPIPSSWEGHSLLEPQIEPYNLHQTRIQNPCYAVLYRKEDKIYKYMYWTGGDQRLFELTSDPRELRDLKKTADPSFIEQLREKLTSNVSQ
jgi:glucan phosphoethanolaminetransferase (alkaline phosphatase superfamily)